MHKTALITGITGQDGSYLAEFLLGKGYCVHGIVRRASISNTSRIEHLLKDNLITIHDGDLTDSSSLIRIINLEEIPQTEKTPFHPYSPYAVAKQYGFWITKEYREAYGMFAVNGILFNHESERRGENFVTRKITLAASRIACGLQDHLELGNLDSLRDWGYAKDYVECMWLMLQHEVPEDFVIATGEQHTVRDFTERAFQEVGIQLYWEGTGVDEKGYDAKTGKMLICVNPKWFRPTDVDNLWGNPAKAKDILGWNPQKTSYEELIKIMVQHDLKLAKKEAAVKFVK